MPHDPSLRGLIALTRVAGIGAKTARHLLAHVPDVAEVFSMPTGRLLKVEGIGKVTADAIRQSKPLLEEADIILEECDKRKIEVLAITNELYPSRLKQAEDAPAIIYTVGAAPYEIPRMVAVVGTRKNTAYGKLVTQQIVQALASAEVGIVSGLAFGIDTIAHRETLERGAITYAVVATSPDKVYPAQNRELAIQIFRKGRIYSEYAPGSKVDARNFPARNRIVAAMCQATVVVEAAESGGALITGRLAQDYNREVYAVPGPIGEEYSMGCHRLIRDSGAQIFTNVEDLLSDLGWDVPGGTKILAKDKVLPAGLDEQERTVMEQLLAGKPTHIDELAVLTHLGLSQLAGVLLRLEFAGLVKHQPGKKFVSTL